jgi:hypothetical protein
VALVTESPYFFFISGYNRGTVRARSESKCVAVEVLGVAPQSYDKVRAAHIVGQVAEEFTSVRVVNPCPR